MYVTDNPDFSWEERRDAEILANAQAIRRDPERLRRAQAVIKANIAESKAALGAPVPPSSRGRRNPATIERLKVNY